MRKPYPILAVLALAAMAPAARAHVVVQPAAAAPGAEQVLRFVVGHGCNGAPTTGLRVEIPTGVVVRDAPTKAGWTVTLDRDADGRVRAVDWRGGELAPHEPGEFPLAARLPDQPGPIRFAAAQSCGTVTVRWDEAPSPGGERPAHPAPTVTVGAPEAPAATASSPH
jgi:uncharacterized protein YcnI